MKINVNLSKLSTSAEFDLDEVNEAGMAYLIEYGLKQSLNDAMAGAKNASEAEGAWQKRWDAICNGSVATRSGDPLAKHIRAILSQKAKGWNKLDAKSRNAMIQKVREADEEDKPLYHILIVAENRLAEEQGLDDLDLGDVETDNSEE